MYLRKHVFENSSKPLHRMAAITPRLTASSSFAKYVPGVSPSARSGYTKGSRGIWKEFDFEPVEAGVPGDPGKALPFTNPEASEF